MKFTTQITNIANDEESIYGHKLETLVKNNSFIETIFLLLKGQLPSEKETRMLDAMLTAAIDHGPGTASGMTTRIVAAAKNNLTTSVAAGILSMGDRHGGAIEGAAKFFQEHKDDKNITDLVKKLKEQKVRLPGYGHAVLEVDHRSLTLFAIAKEIGFYGSCCQLAEEVERALNAISSKKIPLNIDGSMAAIISDMGFGWRLAKGFFVIARVPGLVAQAYEEISMDTGLKRLEESEIEYIDIAK